MNDEIKKNEIAATPTKPKNNGANWILWWKIDKEALESEVKNYDSLKFFKTSRGNSVACLIFSMVITVIFVCAHISNVWSLADVALMLILSIFIYMRHRWAIIAAMILWTAEKGMQLGDLSHGVNPLMPIIWWCIYMHAFYMAFRVEQERKKLETPKASETI